MTTDLVTITTRLSSLEANIIRTRLEADGISCHLEGEVLAGVAGPMSRFNTSPDNPLGEIAIQVPPHQLQRAREILEKNGGSVHKRFAPNGYVTFVRISVSFSAAMWVGFTLGGYNLFAGIAVGLLILGVLVYLTLKDYRRYTQNYEQ